MKVLLAVMIGATALVSAAGLASARAHVSQAVVVTAAWSRPTPPGAPTAAGYLTVINHGDKPDRLLSADSPVAPTLGLHSMTMTGGIMRMRAMPEGLVIGPHTTVTLDPNGYHLMFEGLSEPFKSGDKVPAVLHFQRAGAVAIRFTVSNGVPAMTMR